MFTHIICKKLDTITLSKSESKASTNYVSNVEYLIIFLDKRSHVLEAIETSRNILNNVESFKKNKSMHQRNKSYKNTTNYISLIATTDIKCFLYKLSDTIYKFSSFLTLSVKNSIKQISELSFFLNMFT